MAGTPPLFLNIGPGTTPVLQPGWSFTNRVYGLDDGKESYYVHPGLPKSQWPKVGNTSLANAGANPQMFAVEVTPREDESTLILLEVAYKGIAGTKPDKITPDCDVQLLTMPTGTTSTGSGSTNYQVIIPVPQPKATREYVATTAPNYAGVGVGFAAAWLPAPPGFNLSITPTAGSTITTNYWQNSWYLQARTWQEIVPGKVWFVRETAVFTYKIASG